MADIKTINAVPVAGIKTYDNIPLASVKTINALTFGAPAGPVQPDEIPGLGAWYRADVGASSVYTAQFTTANSEYLSVPHNPTLQLGDADWTVGGWFFLDAIASYQILLSKRDVITPCELSIYLTTGTATVHAEVSPATAIGAVPLTVGAWNFVAVSYDSTSNLLGIQINNGTIVTAALAAPPATTHPFRLGSQISGGSTEFYWGGRMQNIFIFGRLLNTADRTFLYNAGAGRQFKELDTAFKTNIRAWWPLDELSGSRRDVSGNGNTLTDNNTVTYAPGLIHNQAGNNLPVYTWLDSGPNHLDVGALIGAPILIENAQNGQPAVLFPPAGATRFQRATPVLGSLLSGTNAGTIFAVLYQIGAYPNNALYGWLNPSPTNHIALYPTYAGSFDWDIGSAVPATGRIHVAAPAPWADTWHLLELCRNGSAGEILYEGTVVTGGTFSDDLENTGSATWGVGWDNSGTLFTGYLGELLMYNRALSATERDSVRGYLQEKWFAAPEPDTIPGLQAWYKADEGVKSRSAAQIAAANLECLSIASNTSLQLGNIPWTIGCWFKMDSAPAVAAVLIGKRVTATYGEEYQIYLLPSGQVIANTASVPGSTFTTASGPIVSMGAWHFVTASFDGAGTLSLQVDNGAVVSSSGPTVPNALSGQVRLGAADTGLADAYHLTGALQNAFIFGRKLNATECAFLYNGGAGRPFEELDAAFKADLRAWWPLDEQSGLRQDKTANSNHLTDVNTVTVVDGLVWNAASHNAPIGAWDDSSGGGSQPTQITLANRPIYFANQLNGLPSVSFNGSTHYLYKAPFPLSAEYTTFIVSKAAAIGTAVHRIGFSLGPSHSHTLRTAPPTGANEAVCYNTLTQFAIATVAGDALVWHRDKVTRSTTGIELWFNNTAGGAVAATGTSLTGAGTLDIGRFDAAAGLWWTGYIAEILYYNRVLSGAEQLQVEAYLMSKWGV